MQNYSSNRLTPQRIKTDIPMTTNKKAGSLQTRKTVVPERERIIELYKQNKRQRETANNHIIYYS